MVHVCIGEVANLTSRKHLPSSFVKRLMQAVESEMIDNLIFIARGLREKHLLPRWVTSAGRRLIDEAAKVPAALPGYRHEQWVRAVQVDDWQKFVANLKPSHLDALEISPGAHSIWHNAGFRSYVAVQYPEFNIETEALPRQFDVIIAEHVFEHLRRPYAAARNVRSMLKDDGVFLIATPFLIRIHGEPGDYTRWTPDGLAGFLEDCGFRSTVHAWGNRKVVAANLYRWLDLGLRRDLRNESELPTVVWAYAYKTTERAATEFSFN